MELCRADYLPRERIEGMGRLDAASQASRYAPLTRREPELDTADPVWMIQLAGEVPQRGGEIWIRLVCIVEEGSDEPGFYATGGVLLPTGELVPPIVPSERPIFALPPLTF